MLRGTWMLGGKAAAETGAVKDDAVRCSAWLGFEAPLMAAQKSI